MSFKKVYVPVCTQCKKENNYQDCNNTPKKWIGFTNTDPFKIEYIYGDDEGVSGDNVKSISKSITVFSETLFCDIDCYQAFMLKKINDMRLKK